MDETQFLKDRYKAQNGLIDAGELLASYSMNFFMTGNTEMAEKLYAISKSIIDNLHVMDDAFGELFRRYVSAVDQGTVNMLDAVIAASTLTEMVEEEKK